MIETTADVIVHSPWGRYTTTGNAIVWCKSRMLCGTYLWGKPDADETRAIMRLFETYPRITDPQFDMIIDTRAVESVDADALGVLTSWMWTHRKDMRERMKITSIVRPAATGFLLAGLLPTIASNPSFRVVTDAEAAFQEVVGDAGLALAAELEAIALRLRGIPRELQVVRALLAKRVDLTIGEAADELAMSARSLQRRLGAHATSFHDEVTAARMTVASELLLTTALKVVSIAARVGISERALTMLFRTRTGLSPMQWRRENAKR